MAYLLHIETTSTICSVSISENEKIISSKEMNDGYSHAENLHLFIKEVISESNITINDLAAISISSGPGSYTGLRIGFSAAKGLSYALNIPLIKIDTLKSLSNSIISETNQDAYYCPLIDARRMEVYFAIHDSALNEINKPSNLILTEESISIFNLDKPVYFFGDGITKAKSLLESNPKFKFIEDCMPSSKHLVKLAYNKFLKNDFEDLAYSEPFYLKDFFFTSSTK